MDNDSGRGSRSDQPPPLATVRPLHLNELTAGAGAAEDDWYETERLTGQITGRAQSAAATEEPPAALEPPPTLDWRHADPEPPPSATQRLRRGLGRRRGPRAALRLPRAERWLRGHRETTATHVPASTPSEVPALAATEAVARPDDSARPTLGFRHGSEHEEPTPRRPLGARIRAQMPRLAWARDARIVGITLVMAAAATIGIAAALTGSPPKAHQVAVVDSGARQASDFAAVTKALTVAAGLAERQISGDAKAHHSVRARHANRASRPPSHRAHRHPPKSRTAAPAATPASTASSSGSSTSSSPTYTQSTSTPSTSSGSGTSESASTATTQHSQSTQPPYGQNGVLGPGRGAPGTQ